MPWALRSRVSSQHLSPGQVDTVETCGVEANVTGGQIATVSVPVIRWGLGFLALLLSGEPFCVTTEVTKTHAPLSSQTWVL